MNKTIKIAALAGVLAIVAGISLATVEQATAQMLNPTHPDVSRLSPKSFGAKTAGIVCGDRLCDQHEHNINIEEDTPIGTIAYDDTGSAPTAKLISIDKFRASTNQQDAISYRITFSITAGPENLRDIEAHVTTDMGSWEYEMSSLNALSSSVGVLRVKALDPDSINGEIVGYSITGPTSSDPNAPR